MRKTPRKRALPPGSYKQNILAIEATPHTRRLMQATSVFATFAHKRPKSVVLRPLGMDFLRAQMISRC